MVVCTGSYIWHRVPEQRAVGLELLKQATTLSALQRMAWHSTSSGERVSVVFLKFELERFTATPRSENTSSVALSACELRARIPARLLVLLRCLLLGHCCLGVVGGLGLLWSVQQDALGHRLVMGTCSAPCILCAGRRRTTHNASWTSSIMHNKY